MKFDKTKFSFHKGNEGEVWAYYAGAPIDRFRHSRPMATAKDFANFLTKNFTVEEYMEAAKRLSPVLVAKQKGYVPLVVREHNRSLCQ